MDLEKCNEFAYFFNTKIHNIRQAINTSISTKEPMSSPSPHKDIMVKMSQFSAINNEILIDTVNHLKSSTCSLDIVTNQLLKEHVSLNSIRHISDSKYLTYVKCFS